MKTDKTGWSLITGASTGLGRAIAEILASEGRSLILVGRDEARLEAARRELAGQDGKRAIAIRCDLSKSGAAASLHRECVDRGLVVDSLVNNAGAGVFGESLGIPGPKLESMVHLNIIALTQLCALFGADMKARGSGRILNIGSFAGGQATPYFASYAATKSYVLYYSLALRAELAGTGVSVSCLLPGYIRTAFDDNAGAESPAYRAFSASNAMSAQDVARIGIRTLEKGRACAIAGARNRLAASFFALMPKRVVPLIQKAVLDGMLSKGGKL